MSVAALAADLLIEMEFPECVDPKGMLAASDNQTTTSQLIENVSTSLMTCTMCVKFMSSAVVGHIGSWEPRMMPTSTPKLCLDKSCSSFRTKKLGT